MAPTSDSTSSSAALRDLNYSEVRLCSRQRSKTFYRKKSFLYRRSSMLFISWQGERAPFPKPEKDKASWKGIMQVLTRTNKDRRLLAKRLTVSFLLLQNWPQLRTPDQGS